jgi:hypothetical protein
MSEQETEINEPLIHDLVSGEAQGPQSLHEQLRAKREEIAETRDTLIGIIGYTEPLLLTRHGLMDRVEVEQIGKRILRETKDRGERNMRLVCDQIINSTKAFFFQRATDIEPILLEDEHGTPIERWDQLATYLGWEQAGNGTARAALYFVFGDNEFAIGQYAIKLNRWMGNTAYDVDTELLGEGV